MFSLGSGERPDYGKLSPSGQYFASPVTYNPDVSASRKDIIYRNLTLKSRFRAFNHNVSGPGPAKYNTAAPSGSTAPSFTINTRHIDSKLFADAQFMPGPDAYNVILAPGKTMDAIKLKGRDQGRRGQKTPGPGQYEITGDFDM